MSAAVSIDRWPEETVAYYLASWVLQASPRGVLAKDYGVAIPAVLRHAVMTRVGRLDAFVQRHGRFLQLEQSQYPGASLLRACGPTAPLAQLEDAVRKATNPALVAAAAPATAAATGVAAVPPRPPPTIGMPTPMAMPVHERSNSAMAAAVGIPVAAPAPAGLPTPTAPAPPVASAPLLQQIPSQAMSQAGPMSRETRSASMQLAPPFGTPIVRRSVSSDAGNTPSAELVEMATLLNELASDSNKLAMWIAQQLPEHGVMQSLFHSCIPERMRGRVLQLIEPDIQNFALRHSAHLSVVNNRGTVFIRAAAPAGATPAASSPDVGSPRSSATGMSAAAAGTAAPLPMSPTMVTSHSAPALPSSPPAVERSACPRVYSLVPQLVAAHQWGTWLDEQRAQCIVGCAAHAHVPGASGHEHFGWLRIPVRDHKIRRPRPVFDTEWATGYHGCDARSVASILKRGFRLPGTRFADISADNTANDRYGPHVWLTRSFKYASLYSSARKLPAAVQAEQGRHWVILEARYSPDYAIKLPATLPLPTTAAARAAFPEMTDPEIEVGLRDFDLAFATAVWVFVGQIPHPFPQLDWAIRMNPELAKYLAAISPEHEDALCSAFEDHRVITVQLFATLTEKAITDILGAEPQLPALKAPLLELQVRLRASASGSGSAGLASPAGVADSSASPFPSKR